MSHATVKDIAKLAGVSTATVSRVINASTTVSPRARTAVITAIDQLQYIPNRNASELALIAYCGLQKAPGTHARGAPRRIRST